jgi:hypothetical protein
LEQQVGEQQQRNKKPTYKLQTKITNLAKKKGKRPKTRRKNNIKQLRIFLKKFNKEEKKVFKREEN